MLTPLLGAVKNEGRMVMFYVKEKTGEIEVKVELNSENVFCACPDCDKEVADSLGDMYGTAVLCNECAWKRLHVKLKRKEG